MKTQEKDKRWECLLWSIAFPGFGQLLNRQLFTGILLIFLEIVINVQSHFNKAIQLSFLGETKQALEIVNLEWLMFYPCIYFYAMWDAFKNAGGGEKPFAFLPFVFAAFFVTIGLMYSSQVTIFGVLFGPVWFPMLLVIPGVIIGLLIQKMLIVFYQ